MRRKYKNQDKQYSNGNSWSSTFWAGVTFVVGVAILYKVGKTIENRQKSHSYTEDDNSDLGYLCKNKSYYFRNCKDIKNFLVAIHPDKHPNKSDLATEVFKDFIYETGFSPKNCRKVKSYPMDYYYAPNEESKLFIDKAIGCNDNQYDEI